MKRAIRWIETIVQVITVILSVLTAIQIFNAWVYKRKMAAKAQDYLEDEVIPEENLGSTIDVYSPTIKENNHKIKALLAATGAGCMILVGLNLLKAARD